MRPGALSRRDVPVHPGRPRAGGGARLALRFAYQARPRAGRRVRWRRSPLGLLPREIGRRVDPHDAYPSQFELSTGPQALLEHARLLLLHCLPRLIAGTELNSIEQTGLALYARYAGDARTLRASRPPASPPGRDEWLAVAMAAVFVAAVIAVVRDSARARDPARKAVSCGVLGSAVLIVAGFLVNRNIYNSDNYRYLIFLLTPWSLGFRSHDGRAGAARVACAGGRVFSGRDSLGGDDRRRLSLVS